MTRSALFFTKRCAPLDGDKGKRRKKEIQALVKCDGVFDYSAHHRYTVFLHHNHDSYTSLRSTAGKKKQSRFTRRHII